MPENKGLNYLSKMIKKLRRRVVALTMIAVFVVLLLLMGIVNLANYIITDKSVDNLLDLLEENGGNFPMFGKHDGGPPMDHKDDMDDFDGNMKPGMSKETPYETRYFSVTLDQDQNLVYMDTTRVAAVSTDQALELAKSVSGKSKDSAYTSQSKIIYKYRKVDLEDGNTMYIFLNASKEFHSAENVLLISTLVSLVGFIAIGILVIALSPMMIKPIAESYDKQKKFITNAGHELKTPLAVIRSCNEVAELEGGESKWTSAITEQVDRMSDLIGSLVSLAKMDEAQEVSDQLPKESLNLSTLLEETLEPFKLVAQQKDLGFDYEIASPNINIQGNKNALVELINILADNAIKYCSDKGNILFTLSQKGSKIILTEKNPADDLEPGNQNILFDRFYQGDLSHNKDSGGGFGIGLSMAQSIVIAHGGTITAESPTGKEIIFTATF
ncbi:MAG: HAMP domain-containing histidine kinase [Firmicutes bacterium]|nr:HAMP domain-containing histidine kinase [Bacillota bacterium]